MLLLVLAGGLIQTSTVQNWLVGMATKELSGRLGTEVKIDRVDLSLFNRAYLEGTLVRDQKKDTLLYAGALTVSITDWFFLRDRSELHYLGLKDAHINLRRSDSTWNYAFIADKLGGSGNKDTTAKQMIIDLRRVELSNIRFNFIDGWKGQDMVATLAYLDLQAEGFDAKGRSLKIASAELIKPTFTLRQYTGNRPDSLVPRGATQADPVTGLKWNTDDWDIAVKKLTMKDGVFRNEMESNDPRVSYFDPNHIEFAAIQAALKDMHFRKDTLRADIKVSTRERSGFTVNSLESHFSFHPEGMIFEKLDIRTPYSHLRHYYAMRYKDFNDDMSRFMHRVKLEGRFSNSVLGARDIAYFAPELDRWNKQTVRVDGSATGTIDDLQAKNFTIQYGKNTVAKGNIRITGLPDMDKTVFDLQADELRTNYDEVLALAPELADIKEVDLRSLGSIRTRGHYKGTLRDFNADAIVESALGNAQANVHMTLPRGKSPSYAGTVSTTGFNLGKLIGDSSVGQIAFNGTVKGTGFSAGTGNIDVNGKVNSITWNDYTYTNVDLQGVLRNKRFTGVGTIDDPNFKGRLDGTFNLDPALPEFNMLADVQRANLKPLHFAGADMRVLGKFRLNFQGATLDDLIGEASLYDVALTKGEETYVFDTLYLYAMRANENKRIEVRNGDVNITLDGRYNIREIPATVSNYLNKYYPLYFNASKKPLPDQEFELEADLKNVGQYLPLFDRNLNGLDNSVIHARIDTRAKLFDINASIPYLSYKRTDISDIDIKGKGDMDSLALNARAGLITVNDSLQFPSTSFSIRSSRDVSDVHFSTAANQTINAADLSARITNLKDGLKIHFNPSSIVLNEKTWRINRDGELTISRSLVDASEIRIVNGEQEIRVSSLPSETGYSNDLILNVRKVNLGDFLPMVMKEPKIEGITSGDVTIEDPLNKLRIYVNAQTEQTRFENDSIGMTTLNGYWDQDRMRATYHLLSENPGYLFRINGSADLKDSTDRRLDASFDIERTKLSFLNVYLKDIFTDLQGTGSGRLRISGPLREPELTGSVKVSGGSLMVDYTKCRYTLEDPVIDFRPGVIDFGDITIHDVYGNTGQVKGRMTHHFFRDMGFEFTATTDKLLLINTTKTDNSAFYGKAIGRALFQFSGPEEDMRMLVKGEPVDSSFIDIITYGSSKQKGDVDYIKWRQYGREMNRDSLRRQGSNLNIDLDLTANPLAKLRVVLDEQTGDVIAATGRGNLKINYATNKPMTMTGRYNIDRGYYNFNFQDIFQKPFILEQGSGSYLNWNGDPYNAEIAVNATYIAEKVRMSTLFDDPASSTISGVNSDVLKELSDVHVVCAITGTLNQPLTNFQIGLPVTSTVRNNPTVDSKLKNINRDQNEASKQATYLIVFKSFAPQSAIVTSDLNSSLINNTISGVINAILSNSLQNFFYKLFGSSMNVNVNYSRMITNATGTTADQGTAQNVRENVSLEFIKSLMDNKLIITFGSDFNFSAAGNSTITNTQSFLFLPDVNVEYKITPDGKLRTSFFYRSSFDALSTSGRRDRTGGNISYRTEFNSIFGKRRKAPVAVVPQDSLIEQFLQ